MTQQQQSADPSGNISEKEKPLKPEEGEKSEECRCKEVSKKRFPELLRLMLKDLAFWKKKDS